MQFQRGSGILLHITSLPSKYGIGDFGPEAYQFVDKLAEAGQKYWQILPINQTGYGDSPYLCLSAFAGNVNLISPEKLAELVPAQNIPPFTTTDGSETTVNFGAVVEYKGSLLNSAFEIFRDTQDQGLIDDFHKFCAANAFWLDDYALFLALRSDNGYATWNEWPEPIRRRDLSTIEDERVKHDDSMFSEKFRQYIFFRQWSELKAYANEKGIKIIGDIPIYVAYDSADVWCNQSKFKLREDGRSYVVAGVPPDYFSKEGQLWGNPTYDWEHMRGDGFSWWINRIKFNLGLFDIVRLDHFIGFARAWEVPAGNKTAEHGEWADIPGMDLFNILRDSLGDLPLIAEDLGEVTIEVEQLRDTFDIAGMRVLQFAFGSHAWNVHLPHNYVRNSVCYTATHDNETTVGWYKAGTKRAKHIKHCLKYLKSKGREINWDMIDAAFRSVADLAIVPMQDVLGLDDSARMNTPATGEGNWSWRVTREQLDSADWQRLRELDELFAR